MNYNKRQKRAREIKIRLSNDEHAKLMARKNQRSLAGWIRDFCLTQNQTTGNKVILELDPIIRRQLIGISTNINQMSRHINYQKLSPMVTATMLIELQTCREILDNIQTEIKNYQS